MSIQHLTPSRLLRMSLAVSTLASTLACSASAASPAAAPPPDTQAQHDKRMEWFRDARFGLFIHWGVYSVPAGEWQGKTNYGEWFLEETKMPVSQYEKFATQFNPVKFNANDWVRMAKDAGMKYIVITSKHHDGFGMFRSGLTDWCIKSTPFQRDPLKELAAACKAQGIRLCFYHSIMDWHHPDWGTRRAWNDRATGTPDMDRYVDYMKGQLKELLTGYGPIGILWFDGEWESPWTHDRGVDLYNYVRGLQPKIIINNRVGKARAGMGGMDSGAERVGDYGTPEQEIPATGFGPGVDWESCMTMNNHWGYNKNDNNWKSSATLIRNLIDCSSKGGNYLLNVGPTSEGLFPDASVERLAEIGKWMKVNSEAIYGTTASPFKRLGWGKATKKATRGGATIYLHVFDWPSNGQLVVRGLKTAPTKAYLLVDKKQKALSCSSADEGVTVSVPEAPDPAAASTTVVLKIKGDVTVEDPGLVQESNGAATLSAADARLHGSQVKVEGSVGRENLGYWINANDWADWELMVTKPGKFDVTADVAALGSGSFEVQAAGKTLKATAPVTGQYTRYKTVNLGTIELSQPGKVTISVRPVKDGWQPVNLRAIRLKPAA